MKQLAFYITLLFCAYCVHGDISQNSTIDTKIKNATQNVDLLSTTEKSCPSWENTKEHDGGMIMSKPKLVVTFLANSKPIDKIDGFGGGVEPFFVDPFQRLLQFFFSSFARDFNPKFSKEEEIDFNDNIKEKAEKDDNASEFDWLAKKEEPNRMFCEHGSHGFCRSCHIKAKNMLDVDPFIMKRDKSTTKPEYSILHFNISNLVNTDLNVHNITKLNTLNTTQINTTVKSSSTTKHPIKAKKGENVQHKRHYFLSISGDTAQRVAAPKTSDHSDNRRVKRNHINSDNQQDNQNFFKILEETIYETLNNNTDILRKQETGESSEVTKLPGGNPSDSTNSSDPNSDYDNENIPTEEDDHELYDFGITPHVAEYSHGWTYFFLVTLPVFCTFAVVIIFLCIFLRTRGWCCRLFLKDPSKSLQERNAKKYTNTKKKEKQIILA